MKETKFDILQNIEAVIFDLDGTLYNKKYFAIRLLLNNLKDIFIIQKERKTRNKMRGLNFNSSEEYYSNFFKNFSNFFKNKKYSEEFLRNWYFNKYMPQFTYVLKKYYKSRPSTEKIFNILKSEKIKFAVLSDYPFVAERIKVLKLTEIFNENYDYCFCTEDFGALKPSRIPFDELAKKLSVANENVLVVGDKPDTDGEGAKNAGMKFIDVCKFFSFFND